MKKYIKHVEYLKALKIVKDYDKQLEDGITDEEIFLLRTPLAEIGLTSSMLIVINEAFTATSVEDMSIYTFEEIANTYKQNDHHFPKIGYKSALKIVEKLNEFKAEIEIPDELI